MTWLWNKWDKEGRKKKVGNLRQTKKEAMNNQKEFKTKSRDLTGNGYKDIQMCMQQWQEEFFKKRGTQMYMQDQ